MKNFFLEKLLAITLVFDLKVKVKIAKAFYVSPLQILSNTYIFLCFN